MKYSSTQQLNHRPASFWQLCVLLLLLNSLAFIGWVDFRQAPIPSKSGVVGEFNQVTLANHRDHFRFLLNIKVQPSPDSSDGDSEQSWLTHFTALNFPVVLLIHATNLYYLTLPILNDVKYHLPFTRAPPHP